MISEISMIAEIGGEFNMTRGDFWQCVAMSISAIRNKQFKKISKLIKGGK